MPINLEEVEDYVWTPAKDEHCNVTVSIAISLSDLAYGAKLIMGPYKIYVRFRAQIFSSTLIPQISSIFKDRRRKSRDTLLYNLWSWCNEQLLSFSSSLSPKDLFRNYFNIFLSAFNQLCRINIELKNTTQISVKINGAVSAITFRKRPNIHYAVCESEHWYERK